MPEKVSTDLSGEGSEGPARQIAEVVGEECIRKQHKHRSDLGKNALSLGIVCLVLIVFALVTGLIQEISEAEWPLPLIMVVGLAVAGAFFGAIISLVLGLIRLSQRSQVKKLAIAALCIDLVSILLLVFFHKMLPLILDLLN